MGFDELNLTNAKFFIFFEVCPLIAGNFDKKKYEKRDNFLKAHYFVKRLTLPWIKSSNQITVVII